MIHEHEISRDPMIKRETRRYFKEYGVVSVSPTEKGISKIDQMNPYYVSGIELKLMRNTR